NTTVYGSNGLDINNGAVTLGKDGLNAGGVTVGKDGINANDKTISNVGDAVNGKDATNLQQVQDIVAKSGEGSQAATDALGNSLAQNLGGSSTYKDGVVTAPNYQITNLDGSNSTAATVGDAISSLNTAVTTPLTFTGDSGSSTNKLGTTLAITGDDNITTTASEGKVAVTLNKDLTGLNSVQTVDANDPNKVSTLTAGGTTVTDGTNTTVYGSNGLDINNGAVTLGKDGLNAGGVTVGKDGINANDKTISNVGDAVNGKDATNLQQVQDIVAKSGEGSQAATDALGNSLA
ncbi:hypothetical protein RFH38_21255, partial [Acinetobacter gerneri]|nr:hypothetical protein [Acinetobacter gerneri]